MVASLYGRIGKPRNTYFFKCVSVLTSQYFEAEFEHRQHTFVSIFN